MRTYLLIIIATLLGLAGLAATASAHHWDDCHGAYLTTCEGTLEASPTANPTWWSGSLADIWWDQADDPIWTHLEASHFSKAPYRLNVTATGNITASVDVWKVHDETPPAENKKTPPCPQGYAKNVFYDDLDNAASPSHLHEALLTIERHHILTDDETLSLEIPRDEEWIVALDVRATDELPLAEGDNGTLDYQLSVDHHFFNAQTIQAPQDAVETSEWSDDLEDCITYTPEPDPEASSPKQAEPVSGECEVGRFHEDILLPSSDPDRGAIEEYLEFLLFAGNDNADEGSLPGAPDEDLDAYIHDAECHLRTGAYEVAAGTSGTTDTTVTVRFYDHFAKTLHETDCDDGHRGEIPDYTRYIAIAPCEGAPSNPFSPNTAEISLRIW